MVRAIRALCVAAVAFTSVITTADEIRMYTRGDQSLAAHLQAMASARYTIDIFAFEFAPCDASTKMVIDLLTRKAREGVKVRLIVDDFGISDWSKRGLAAYLLRKGIQFRVYNASFFIFQNHRSHVKLTLIDGGSQNPTYFAASSNYADSYFGLSATRNYVNRDFLIQGPSGYQVQAAFEKLWKSHMTSATTVGDHQDFYNRCLTPNARDHEVASYFNANGAFLAQANSVSCSNFEYAVDDGSFLGAHHDGGREHGRGVSLYMNESRLSKKVVTKQVLDFINGTRTTLNVENQYFIPAELLSRAFMSLRDSSRDVLVFTNLSARGVDEQTSRELSHFILQASRYYRDDEMAILPLPSLGRLANPHPLTPVTGTPWHLHSKSMVRDHRDVWMGSFNIDPRSYHTNLEYGVTVRDCPALASLIEPHYERMLTDYGYDYENCSACMNESSELNPIEIVVAFFKKNFL